MILLIYILLFYPLQPVLQRNLATRYRPRIGSSNKYKSTLDKDLLKCPSKHFKLIDYFLQKVNCYLTEKYRNETLLHRSFVCVLNLCKKYCALYGEDKLC